MQVGDICRYPGKPRPTNTWAVGVIVKIEDNRSPNYSKLAHNYIYHVLGEDGSFSRHDFVMRVLDLNPQQLRRMKQRRNKQ
jgi:hypothetical protein